MRSQSTATESDTTHSPRGHGRAIALTVAAVVVGLVVAAGIYIASGAWYVEYECSKGEAPASSPRSGNGCFKEGSDLPSGFTFDEGGNKRIN